MKCIQRYNGNGKCVLGGKDFIQSLQCSDVHEGVMPWRAGKRRMDGQQYIPGDRTTSDLGHLPYYDECPTVLRPGPGRRWRNASTAALTAMQWNRDCDPLLAQECTEGYYATLSDPFSLDDANTVTLQVLALCTICPDGASGGGSLLLECTCPKGTASYKTLQALFSPLTVYVPNMDVRQSCVNCLTSVLWRHTSVVRQEALVCADNVAIMLSGPRQYVDSTTKAAAVCGVLPPIERILYNRTQVARPERTGCYVCPAGSHIDTSTNPHSCKQCATGKYQDKEGQATCIDKRHSCAMGEYMISDSDATAKTTSDYNCKLCDKACPKGESQT